MEISMTKANSEVQVLFNGTLLIVDFPFDYKFINTLKQVEGAEWSTRIEKKWTVPKKSYAKLVAKFQENGLSEKIVWKTADELKKDATDLNVKEETLEEVLERIPTKIDTSFLKIDPYDFQKVAVGWAVTPKGKRGQIYGGLLADLMGLGKTLESLAITGYLKKQGKIKNCLVICPATLKMQWGQEIEKFTNENYIVIDGGKGTKAREKRLAQYKKAKEDGIMYTIVNYELLFQKERLGTEEVGKGKNKRNKTVYGDYIDLRAIIENDYDMVVIDEAHRMKNPETETAGAIRQIEPPYRLLMTGTPIEKDLQNIFQLVDYLSPNVFADKNMSFEERKMAFEEKFIITGFNPYKLKYGVKERIITGVKNVGLLKKTVAPYILRRTTEDVSDELPDVTESMIVVGWDDEQKKLYERLQNDLLTAKDAEAKSKDEEEAEKYRNEANAMLMYMLETCNTPELLVMSESMMAKKKLGKKTKFDMPPKLKRLVELVEEIAVVNGEKVVIFTKFERMTQILQRELTKLSKDAAKKDKNKGFGISMYTGDVPKGCAWKTELDKQGEKSSDLACNQCPFNTSCNTRTKNAWYFQNDPSTKVIIATDAGNYGVNLQSGKHLVNYDLPYSSSVYDQRGGRIRRLGSKHNKVYIYNLVTTGGIDEALYGKILKQKEIIDQVVEKTEVEEEAIIRATRSMEIELIEELRKNKK